jgi:hypothetical protein
MGDKLQNHNDINKPKSDTNTNNTTTTTTNNNNNINNNDNIYSYEFAFYEEKIGLKFKFENGNVIISGYEDSNHHRVSNELNKAKEYILQSLNQDISDNSDIKHNCNASSFANNIWKRKSGKLNSLSIYLSIYLSI